MLEQYRIKPRDEAEEEKWNRYYSLGEPRKANPSCDSVAESVELIVDGIMNEFRSRFLKRSVRIIKGDWTGRAAIIEDVVLVSDKLEFYVYVPSVKKYTKAKLGWIEFDV